MTFAEYLEWIARDSETFASVLTADALDARVPGCPDWSLRELAWHLGRVQRFWADVVRRGVDVQPEFGEETPGPSAAAELTAWMRASTQELLGALGDAGPERPAWSWWRDRHTSGAIGRHQVQEAAVHRWDAQSAAGTPEPLAPEVADDGVAEFVFVMQAWRDPVPLAFVATDTGRRVAVSDQGVTTTVSAPASDLVLFLHRRIGIDAVTVDGDPGPLDAYLAAVD